MAFSYPRKQTVMIFMASLVVVISVAYYASFEKNGGISAHMQGNVAQADIAAAASSSNTIDTGTADWRKQFEGTVKAPSGKATSAKPAPLTQTDNLSRDFFSKYVDLKQSNLLNNQDIVSQTAQDLVTSHIQTQPKKTFTSADLHITTATDKASLTAFSTAVARVLESYKVTKNEYAFVQDYLSTNDTSKLKGIDPIIATYNRMILAFVKIPTPQIMAEKYLEIINGFNTLDFAAGDLRASDSDSVRSLAGVSAHATGDMLVINGITDLHQLLLSNGVNFTFNQNYMNTLLN